MGACMQHRGLCLGLPLVLLAAAGSAFADGAYFSEVAYPKLPEIPAQRAVIAWRGGVETLIVESTLDSESKVVGWVLPLPGEPTRLEKVDPGVLTTLAVAVAPRFVHDLRWPVGLLLLGLLVTVPIILISIFERDPARRRRRLGLAVLLGLLAGVMVLAVAPGFPGAGHLGGGSGEPAVRVVSTEHVGSYDVSVLRA